MIALYWVYQRANRFNVALKIENEVLHLTDREGLLKALTSVKCLVTYGGSQELALILSEGKSKYMNQYLHIDLSQELGNKSIEEIGYFTGTDLRAGDVKKFCEIRLNVCQLIFEEREEYIENKFQIIKEFKLKPNAVSKTRANLAAEVLGAIKQPNRANVLLYRYDKRLKLTELPKKLIRFYDETTTKYTYSMEAKLKDQRLKLTLAGLTHTFGFGGVHAAKENYKGKGFYLHIDAKSFFTSIMVNNSFISTAVKDKTKVKKLHDKKVIGGDNAYKTVINAMVGSMNNPYSKLYDPNKFFSITVSGQLMMAHLVLILENFIEELIQTNTDGIVVKISPEFETIVVDLTERWANYYQLQVKITKIKQVIQKNVNNYIMVTDKNEVWRIGIYSEPNYLSGSLNVVSNALFECMTTGIKPQEFIINTFKSGELSDFHYIKSISKDCEYIAHKVGATYNKMNDTVCGVATTNKRLGGLYQIKKDLYSKLPGSPVNFMNASQVKKSDIDVSWYVEQVESLIFRG